MNSLFFPTRLKNCPACTFGRRRDLESTCTGLTCWRRMSKRLRHGNTSSTNADVKPINDLLSGRYRSFPCENYPEHVCRMGQIFLVPRVRRISFVGERCSYAFKAIVLAELLEKHQCVIWLDAGIEVTNHAPTPSPIFFCPGAFPTRRDHRCNFQKWAIFCYKRLAVPEQVCLPW